MDIVLAILKSNALSVLLGGFLTLFSVYLIEFLKEGKEIKKKKNKLICDIIFVTNKIYYYAVLDAQADIFFAYHKRLDEIETDEFHKKEGVRRMLQLEEIKYKRIDLNVELATLNVQYGYYFKKDIEAKALMQKIEKYILPNPTYYDNITDTSILDKKVALDDDEKTHYINHTLLHDVDNLRKLLGSKF